MEDPKNSPDLRNYPHLYKLNTRNHPGDCELCSEYWGKHCPDGIHSPLECPLNNNHGNDCAHCFTANHFKMKEWRCDEKH